MAFPFSTTGSLAPTFVPARLVSLAVKPPYTLTLLRAVSIRPEVTFARLRYSLGGDRPSQTARLAMSSILRVRISSYKGRYPNGGSYITKIIYSKPPAYPVHYMTKLNTKLQ